MAEKSSSTSFWVHAALKRWLKYTTKGVKGRVKPDLYNRGRLQLQNQVQHPLYQMSRHPSDA